MNLKITKRTEYSLESIQSLLEKMIIREHIFSNVLMITKDAIIDEIEVGESVNLPVLNRSSKAVEVEEKRPQDIKGEPFVKNFERVKVKEFIETLNVEDLEKYCWLFGVSEEIRMYLQNGIISKSVESYLNYLHNHRDISNVNAPLNEESLTKVSLMLEGNARSVRFLVTSTEQLVQHISNSKGFIPLHQLAIEERISPNVVGKIAGLYVLATNEIQQRVDGSYPNYIIEKYAGGIAFSEGVEVTAINGQVQAVVKSLEYAIDPQKIIRLHVK